MNAVDYKESEALTQYISWNFWRLVTEGERQQLLLATQRIKEAYAALESRPIPPQPHPLYVARVALENKIDQRIRDDIRAKQLIVNRCSRCDRIVRTPFAKQCFWCGFNWH